MTEISQTTHGPWREHRLTVRDGLRLAVRHYPARGSTRRPALCLPGLTRNARDFDALARHLSATGPAARDVFTLDARGRGGSDHDSDPANYNLLTEMHDVIDMMIAHGLAGSDLIGTSRGGLVTMLLAAAQPSFLAAAVLNDIGPVLERAGLERIAGYVGKAAPPTTWSEAAAAVRRIDGAFFPGLTDGAWEAIARQRFNDAGGRPVASYDPRLATTISIPDGPLPQLWPQFGALAHVPVQIIRGENSDLLSAETVEEMRRRHPRTQAITVPRQGHAPLLDDAPTMDAIARFLAAAD